MNIEFESSDVCVSFEVPIKVKKLVRAHGRVSVNGWEIGQMKG